MDTRRVDGGRGPGRANPGFVLAVLLLAMADPGPIRGGDETPRAPSPARTGPVEESPQSPGTGGITAGLAELPSEVEWSAPPIPGAVVTIGLADAVPPGTTFRWSQVEGPAVAIEDPTKPKLRLTIPQGCQRLAFLVTLADGRARRTVRVIIPIRVDPGPKPGGTLAADAGDDQLGFAGRRITLKGSAGPRDRVVFRWFQMGGPRIDNAVQDRSYFSFTPTIPGFYRFGLVVAANGGGPTPELSEPDEVMVTVGESPGALGVDPIGPGAGIISSAAIDQALRASGGEAVRSLLDRVAEAFDALSDRVPLYTSFDYLTSEMMRRLDAIIPRDPGARQAWNQGIFNPLTQNMIGEMASVGLDLRFPQAHQQELTAAQKDKLQKLLATYAREFSSRTRAR